MRSGRSCVSLARKIIQKKYCSRRKLCETASKLSFDAFPFRFHHFRFGRTWVVLWNKSDKKKQRANNRSTNSDGGNKQAAEQCKRRRERIRDQPSNCSVLCEGVCVCAAVQASDVCISYSMLRRLSSHNIILILVVLFCRVCSATASYEPRVL